MSKLEELIQEFCLNGVEYYELGQVCDFIKGKGLRKDDIGTGNIPIILYGELYTTYSGYINQVVSSAASEKINRKAAIYKSDIIIPLSSTTKEANIGQAAVYASNRVAYLGSDAAILRHSMDAGYLMYVLNSSFFEKEKMRCVSGTTIRHLSINELSKIRIPLPPLAVQQEIVRILDSFTELTAELTARRKQYEHYRDELLTFDGSVKRMALKDVCIKVQDGNYGKEYPSKSELLKSGVPLINGKAIHGTICKEALDFISEEKNEELKKARIATDDVLFLNRGNIGETAYVPSEFDNCNIGPQVTLLRANKSKILPKYLEFALHSKDVRNFISRVGGGTIKFLSVEPIRQLEIPVPPLAIQKQIVSVLARFDTLCNDLTSGLPAEIAARQKQYEYYRDKLLTFKELER